jgi:hypothetical protein
VAQITVDDVRLVNWQIRSGLPEGNVEDPAHGDPNLEL